MSPDHADDACPSVGADGVCLRLQIWSMQDGKTRRTSLGGTVEVLTRSVITCPKCGAAAEEEMPIDACIYFYECTGCGQLLRPNAGDCCVFCSFGSVKCPPVQQAADCCALPL